MEYIDTRSQKKFYCVSFDMHSLAFENKLYLSVFSIIQVFAKTINASLHRNW